MRMIPALAATIACIAVATPAQAQQKDSAAGTLTVAPAVPTFAQFTALFDSLPARTQSLAAINGLTAERVKFIDVSSLAAGENGKVLDSVLTTHASSIAPMRTVLEAHTVIAPLFAANQLTPANTLALDVASDGVVRVYYRK